ncbi:MAG: glutamyl-tRNA reductase [Pseudomonadota bacterium]
MALQVFGISHKTAPIEIRERLAIGEDQLDSALRALAAEPGINEAAILSTCNRTELYCDVNDQSKGQTEDWIVRFQQLDPTVVSNHAYILNDQPAVKHALKVACGLDSMVVGEPQILGQLKQAYRTAIGSGTAGKSLHRLFQYSFHVAKQIRHQTAIGENPVSVAYAAAKLAQQIHGDLSTKTAVLVGAGETISLVANHLLSHNIRSLIIANRTGARADELAGSVGGTTVPFEELDAVLAQADIVVSSTGSRRPIISKSSIENAIAARDGAPIFLVDLAVPRDVDPQVGDIEDAYLYSVDDLNHVVNENTKARAKAAQEAENLIERETLAFDRWSGEISAKDTIVEIKKSADAIKLEATRKAAKRLAAGDPPSEVLELLANTLTNRILHQPVSVLRDASEDDNDELVRIARLLFGEQKNET